MRIRVRKLNQEYFDTWRVKGLLFCILISSSILVSKNLGHSGLTYWDESFHAIVARNLTKHPLTFTLYDAPWLPFDYTSWYDNHIWLHKPPLALWQICLSYVTFGINTFSLRLPSAISLIVTAWLTFRIAANLFDKRTGLIAAFLHAFNPFLFEHIHGYHFSDHVDLALLLWVEVSCWFLLRAIQSGKHRNYILSGIAMGLAFLSKSYLAFITLGIALTVCFAGRIWSIKNETSRLQDDCIDKDRSTKTSKPDHNLPQIRLSDIGLLLFAAIGTVGPWVIYSLVNHPKEFIWEHKRILDHLNTNVEGWGATWDRQLFDYMPLFYPIFYAALIAAVLCLIVVMFKQVHKSGLPLAELFVLAWSIGVIVLHTLAQTKTPSATMIAVPPLLMCFATIISRAWQQRGWIYTAIWCASMIAITIVPSSYTVAGKEGLNQLNTFAPFIEANLWIIQQLFALGILLSIFLGCHLLITGKQRERFWLGFRMVALLIALLYAVGYVKATHNITARNHKNPLYKTIGQHLQGELPWNACLFLDDENDGSHLDLMYYADRSTYPIYNQSMKTPRKLMRDAQKARESGGIPYLISVKETVYNYPLLLEGEVTTKRKKNQRYRVFEIPKLQ